MNGEQDLPYDVAFSFLGGDEHLAAQLNALLQASCKTFLYSERQKETAGTDGEASFSKVFGEQSRCVVVLYRPEWGSTRWTRIEETAIRNRAHEKGYDFALYIPLHDPPNIPAWMPRSRLWIGLERWGIASAAAVIEARARELGATPHAETIEERAAREAGAVSLAAERKAALNSYAGVKVFHEFKEKLFDAICEVAVRANSSQQAFRLETKKGQGTLFLLGRRHGLSVRGGPRYANTLTDAALQIEIWNGTPPPPDYIYFDQPRPRKKRLFELDFTPERQFAWIAGTDKYKHWSNIALAEEIVGWYIDNAEGGQP